MKEGPGVFNQSASGKYKALDGSEWRKLKELCVEDEVEMTEGAIKKEGARIFRKVQSEVRSTHVVTHVTTHVATSKYRTPHILSSKEAAL